MPRLSSSTALLVLLLGLLHVQQVSAGLLPSRPEFLPVEQAFIPSLENTAPGTVILRFEIAEDYYLYRHRLGLTSSDPSLKLQTPAWPSGVNKQDEYFGDTEVYYGELLADLAYQAPAGSYTLQLSFQGCAEAGLCYPPETIDVELELVATGDSAAPSDVSGSGAPDAHSILSGRSLPSIALFFFLAGIGLALTPCVLPMVPILSSLIVNDAREHPGRARSLLLSGVYVLSMAVTFAVAGLLMGQFGAGLNLQMQLQNPWILVPFAALFVVLALSMFDLYQLRLPDRFAARIAPHESGHRSLWSAAGMGMASSLIVSPCVTAPLAAALLFISSTGDALTGGLALFALGMGMGAPLLLLGAGGEGLLPRAGAWMNRIKQAFGVMLIGLAIWMLERILPGPVVLLAWSALLIFCAIGLGALRQAEGRAIFRRAMGVFALLYGAVLMVGAATGGGDPLAPLSQLTQRDGSPGSSHQGAAAGYQPIDDVRTLQAALAGAAASGRPALLDVYADWCISCKIIEREVLADAQVAQALDSFVLIRADVTKNLQHHRELLEYLDLFGPPGLLFYTPGSGDVPISRIIGEIDASSMLDHVRSVSNTLQPQAGEPARNAENSAV